MESTLKRQDVHIAALGREIEIVELSAKAIVDINESFREMDNISAVAMVCKYGVSEWIDESIEQIMRNVSHDALFEIWPIVQEFSGIDTPKNFDRVPSDDSSSDSLLN